MNYHRKLQFISLPELTNELKVLGRANYLLKVALDKIHEATNYDIEVEQNIITISNLPVSKYLIIFVHNSLNKASHNLIRTWATTNLLYIYSESINEFIKEQLATDNNTLFLPKLDNVGGIDDL